MESDDLGLEQTMQNLSSQCARNQEFLDTKQKITFLSFLKTKTCKHHFVRTGVEFGLDAFHNLYNVHTCDKCGLQHKTFLPYASDSDRELYRALFANMVDFEAYFKKQAEKLHELETKKSGFTPEYLRIPIMPENNQNNAATALGLVLKYLVVVVITALIVYYIS